MHIAESLLDRIVRRILRVCQPDRVILFGSAATGDMTPDSDIDLLVLDPSPTQPRRLNVQLRDALRSLDYPFDVIVMATARFEETKDVIGGIAYPANKYGRVIYDAAA